MDNKLFELEKQLEDYSGYCQLDIESRLLFPENFRQIYKYKIFGDNLLSIPANLIIDGDDDEFEKPFSFLNTSEELDVFETEFRSEISGDFIQIGHLYNFTEVVLLNKIKNTVHVFHVSDIADKDWLNYKLENGICNLDEFVNSIRPQTVCCLINPKDYSEWDIFEIRNETELKTERELMEFKDKKTVNEEYIEQVKKSLEKGFDINYAPQSVLLNFKK
ncbi:hypothetical protein SOM12_04810 [Flavobacterium sp. CFBP9031]|jgi:hypothetical protein|uniref:hypothetical protein n=1 Tax=Flavobacterium sp. CFBP9031 TaxID=3096538 RepID=UPI002A6B6A9E|nr:hypothetical protein [Flavobacterium sp. CFBP9031]MDY0986725.1 hypothetical protein [Flavobacterium sp. CFBP9031]